MKTLILMRHAKSDWSHGVTDHERPLNSRGRKSAAALGQWLRDQGLVPDDALVSDAARTRETWAGLDLPIEARFLPSLYHATAEKIFDLIKNESADTLLILGHNPDIAELAHRLIDTPPADLAFDNYPTGATTILRFDIGDWADLNFEQGQCVAFQTPRPLLP